MPRIVSLVPNFTEILCALGYTEQLVARSHACDYPASVLAVPSCTEPKAALPGIGYSLGDRLRALVQEGLSPDRVDAHLLRDLRPDIIFTQYDLPFSGISVEDLESAAHRWFGEESRLVPLETATISDVWAAFRTIAGELGSMDEGMRVAMQLQHRMAAILRQAAECSQRPRTACLTALDPITPATGVVPELIEMAGGKNVPGNRRAAGTLKDLEALYKADPEIVIIMLGSLGLDAAREALAPWTEREEWRSLRAVQEGEVVLCHGGAVFRRLGPRVVEALEIIAEIVHPDEFQFGHRGQSWEPL